ncbi:MAG: hypothetical protein ABJQ69_03570 [Ekhidna sp.]
MKKADYLIIMCSETPEGQQMTKADLIEQHTNSKVQGGFGWNRPGIDYLVLPDGTLETIIPEDNPNVVDLWGIEADVDGLYGIPKYLAYVGGLTAKASKEKDTRTAPQTDTLEAVVKFYIRKFPSIRVLGMNQVPAMKGVKNPCFNVEKWLSEIDVPQDNIFKLVKPA